MPDSPQISSDARPLSFHPAYHLGADHRGVILTYDGAVCTASFKTAMRSITLYVGFIVIAKAVSMLPVFPLGFERRFGSSPETL